jgi:23S rRNA (cytosine1962-C5)-methyltransferase
MNDRSVPGPAPTSVRPTIVLKAGEHKRVLTGHPWIYSNEVVMDAAAKALAAGSLVRIVSHDGRAVGTAMFSPRPLIAARLFGRDPATAIDRDFLAGRLARALALRNKLFQAPYYRLVHAEADGLPGTVIDRFGDTAVVQINTAGMELLQPALLASLDDVVAPATVILRNDGPMRVLEGLDSYVRCSKGSIDGPIELVENGVRFLADPREGQKTGWFFDQRDNRAAVAGLAPGARLLDVYCYTGGFAVQAAVGGAAAVVGIDRSEPALELAGRAAALNGVAARCRFQRGDAFATLEGLYGQGERFGVVVADPPAFVKSRKEINQAARAYRKLARLAAAVVEPGGFLFIASCSHHMTADNFAEQVSRGLGDAARQGRILRSSGAAADHPVHPALPETAYLKGLLLQID